MARGKNVLQIIINADDKTKTALKEATAGVGAFAAAVTAAMGLSARASVNFSNGIAEIQTLLGKQAGPEVAKMRKELLALSRQSGEALGALTKARYDIISAGFSDAAASAKVLEASMKVAQGGLVEVSAAADLMTTALNGMGLAASESDRVADVLFNTVRLGKTTMTELAANLGQVFATAKIAGVSLEEVGGAMAVITAQGIATPRAATALVALLNALAAPSKEAKVALDALGISLELGLETALVNLAKVGEEGLDKLKELVPSIEALRAAGAAGSDVRKLAAAMDSMRNAAGASAEAASIMGEQIARQAQRIRSQVEVLATRFGDALTPATRALADALEAVTSTLSDLPDGVLAGAAILGGLTAALATAATAAGTLVLAVQKLAPILATLKIGALAALIASPVGAAAAVIGGSAAVLGGSVAAENAIRSRRAAAQARTSAQGRTLDFGAVFAPRGSGTTVQTSLGALDLGQRTGASFEDTAVQAISRTEAIKQALLEVEQYKQSVEGQFDALFGKQRDDLELFLDAIARAGDPAGIIAELTKEMSGEGLSAVATEAGSMRDALDGAAEAASKYNREAKEIEVRAAKHKTMSEAMIEVIDITQDTVSATAQAFGDSFGAMVVAGEKFGITFKRIFDQIKTSILSLVAQKAVLALLKLLLGGAGGFGAAAIAFLGLAQGSTRVPGFAHAASGLAGVTGLPGFDGTPALLAGGEMVLNERRANSLRHALFMPGTGISGKLDRVRARRSGGVHATLEVRSPLSFAEQIEIVDTVDRARSRTRGMR